MSYPGTSNQPRRSRWPVVTLVIASVSAVSLALGLLVVGPMIQHRMSTPPPTLAVSMPTAPAAPAAEPERSAAEVEIKERPQPKPKPKPPPPLTIGISPVPNPDGVGELSTTTDPHARHRSRKPSIDATITHAGADGESAKPGQRDTTIPGVDGAAQDASGSTDSSGDTKKTRKRRAPPLEALPTLGNSLPRAHPLGNGAPDSSATPDKASETRPAAPGDEKEAPAPAGSDERRSARKYRVQVGRFVSEEDARKLRDELAGAGHTPRVVRTEQNGTVVYRVQVGTYAKKDNAERQMQKLREQSYEPEIADDDQ